MRSILQGFAKTLLCAAALVIGISSARAQTFSNTTAISIPGSGTDGRATPYASTISVTGVAAPIDTITVTLNGYSHAYTYDTAVMLVAPGGQRVMLMASAGYAGPVTGLTLTFARDAATALPVASVPVSGIYLPSAYNSFPAPAPAPTTPALTNLGSLSGTSANGTWTLYVWDNFPNVDGGSIAGGWTITLNAAGTTRPVTSKFTYQGKLENAGVPFNGTADLVFSLWDTPFSTNALNRVGGNITKNGVSIANGLVTTDLEFDAAALNAANIQGKSLWLQVEAAVTGGGSFATLTPRQPLNATPQAWNSQRLGGRSLLELAQLGQPNTFTEAQRIEPFGSAVGLTIRASASQGSTVLQRWLNNAGTLLASVGPAGEIRTTSTATASDYLLTTPVTRRKIISSHAFQPYDSTVPYNTSFTLTSATTTFAGFVCPVDLPAGATVSRVIFYVRDNSSIQEINVSASLYSPAANSNSSLGSATSTGATPAGVVTSLTVNGPSVVGDGQILLLQANWNAAVSGTSLGIYGARVEYTIDNVKP